jgi:5-methyltetrahydropteroyltriglutamate--homocysteine methyltransferase
MSMKRSTSRIRTTHTGSLPRPQDMLETLRAMAAGQAVDMAAYETALAKHVADLVRKQAEAGIDTVTDGECSKPSFQHYVAERLGEIHSGFTALRSSLPMNLKARFPGFKIWSCAQADIDRIVEIWTNSLST